MRDLDVSADPADYISGPTGNQTSRTNGGTNRTGGVSVVDVDTDVQNTQSPPAPQQGETVPAPAPAQ